MEEYIDTEFLIDPSCEALNPLSMGRKRSIDMIWEAENDRSEIFFFYQARDIGEEFLRGYRLPWKSKNPNRVGKSGLLGSIVDSEKIGFFTHRS